TPGGTPGAVRILAFPGPAVQRGIAAGANAKPRSPKRLYQSPKRKRGTALRPSLTLRAPEGLLRAPTTRLSTGRGISKRAAAQYAKLSPLLGPWRNWERARMAF